MIHVPKPVRAIVGLIGLVGIIFLVWGWIGNYQAEKSGVAVSEETTATAEPTATVDAEGTPDEGEGGEGAETPEATGPHVIVLIEGLNFRRSPSRDADTIRTLSKDTRLEYIETDSGWYRVRDEDGVEGYVSASGQYTELQ